MTSRSESVIVAYTVGSIWFCTAHGVNIPEAEPVALNNLLDCYDYWCEICGHVIKKGKRVR
ncbi:MULTISPECIES: hypothetical protein [Streptomyces]|uniref:hypothetical protein n=1 Tax=Streptomyces TaxID=1883 RepID=UPI0036592B7F